MRRLLSLVAAAEVDGGGNMRVSVVHRRESVVQVNRVLWFAVVKKERCKN